MIGPRITHRRRASLLLLALCIAIALVATLRYHFIPQLQERAKARTQPADPAPARESSSDRRRASREG